MTEPNWCYVSSNTNFLWQINTKYWLLLGILPNVCSLFERESNEHFWWSFFVWNHVWFLTFIYEVSILNWCGFTEFILRSKYFFLLVVSEEILGYNINSVTKSHKKIINCILNYCIQRIAVSYSYLLCLVYNLCKSIMRLEKVKNSVENTY